jgi:hypothetical protein
VLRSLYVTLCFMFWSRFPARRRLRLRLPLLLNRAFHQTARSMGKPRLIIIVRHAQSEVPHLPNTSAVCPGLTGMARATKIERSINRHLTTECRSRPKDGSKLMKQAGSSANSSGQQTRSTYSSARI